MNQTIDFPELRIAILLYGILIFFYLYYYIAHSAFLENRLNKPNNSNQVKYFLTKKTIGFLLLGLIPGILYYLFLQPEISFISFFDGPFISSLIIVIILVSVIISLTYFIQKSNQQRSSLQMKITEWNTSLFAIDALGWILYLLAYEFLFRGLLLFESYNSFGFWPAIAINVTLYSAIHMINSKSEAIGALLFGTVACYFTLQQGTILIAVFMHIALSLSSDYFSIRINNELKFVKPKHNNSHLS